MNRAKSLVVRSSSALFFGVLLLLSCNGNAPTEPRTQTAPPTQTTPPPQTTQSGTVWGYVQNSTGACITGAVVEVLDGPLAGAKSTQWFECGDVWEGGAYVFRDLPVNTSVRLRASKEGYRSQEMTAYATALPAQANFLLERQ